MQHLAATTSRNKVDNPQLGPYKFGQLLVPPESASERRCSGVAIAACGNAQFLAIRLDLRLTVFPRQQLFAEVRISFRSHHTSIPGFQLSCFVGENAHFQVRSHQHVPIAPTENSDILVLRKNDYSWCITDH